MSDYKNNDRRSKSSTSSGKFSKRGNFGASPSRRRTGNSAGKSKLADIKYDPSLFIKKVEEQTASVAYTAEHLFSDFLIADVVKKNVVSKGYTAPTPIQDKVIPLSWKVRMFGYRKYWYWQNGGIFNSFSA